MNPRTHNPTAHPTANQQAQGPQPPGSKGPQGPQGQQVPPGAKSGPRPGTGPIGYGNASIHPPYHPPPTSWGWKIAGWAGTIAAGMILMKVLEAMWSRRTKNDEGEEDVRALGPSGGMQGLMGYPGMGYPGMVPMFGAYPPMMPMSMPMMPVQYAFPTQGRMPNPAPEELSPREKLEMLRLAKAQREATEEEAARSILEVF